ncbi:hypothetical protein [Bartonella sp. TT121SHDZB]
MLASRKTVEICLNAAEKLQKYEIILTVISVPTT